MSLYLTNFPKEFTPRTTQTEVIKKIEKVFTSGKKYCICCAPTGSGKSLFSKTLANISNSPTSEFERLITSYEAFEQDSLGDYKNAEKCLAEPPFGAFALTVTKALQDQYQTLFPDCTILKGQSNYACDVDENFDVETAPCVLVHGLKQKCWASNRCHYYNARNVALTSKFAALNYKMFLALPGHIKKKNFLICDEASELEDTLIKQFSVEVLYEKLENFGIPHTTLITDAHSKALGWLTDLYNSLDSELTDLIGKLQKKSAKGDVSPSDRYKLSYIKNLTSSVSQIIRLWHTCEFVIERSVIGATFTPLYAETLTPYIFDYADKILLMSATIIDPAGFARSLGIQPHEYEYIEVESEFDPNKSPIFSSSKYKLNYKSLKGLLPTISKEIDKIVAHHKNEKGIIHTHTMEITDFLRGNLSDTNRYIFRESGGNSNEEILDEHFATDKPTVIVSPSLMYGIDLKDSLARFQIIVKLPFLPLSTKRVKILFEKNKQWYTDKMLKSLVQACGRATRTKEDFAVTYILDGNIANIFIREKDKLPAHFIKRIY